jgi:hypothetical protein
MSQDSSASVFIRAIREIIALISVKKVALRCPVKQDGLHIHD